MLFPKEEQRGLVLILEIQSSFVRGSLFTDKNADNIPELIYTNGNEIPFKAHSNSTYLIEETLKHIDGTLSDIARFTHNLKKANLPHRIMSAHYVLSSPWIVSEAGTISKSFDKPTLITHQFIEKLLAENQKDLSSNISEPIISVERKILDINLNGYVVADWQNRFATKLGVSMISSVASKRMMEKFIDICKKHHIHHVNFHSGILLQHIGIKHMFAEKTSYCLTHIHDEVTDIAVVDRGNCLLISSFPIGSRTILRKIASATKSNTSAAESLVALYCGDQLDAIHSKSDMESIAKISSYWSAELDKVFNSEAVKNRQPHEIIIFVNKHDGLYKNALISVIPKSKIEFITTDDFAKFIAFDNKIERDRLSALYTIAIHIILNS